MELTESGPAAPAEVWRRYTQPGLWPTWAPHLVAVDYPHEAIRPDTTGVVRGGVGWVALPVPFTIDSVDETAMTWSWTARLGPIPIAFDHGVRPADRGGATAWVRIGLPLPLAAAYAPLARWALRRLVSDAA